MVYARGMSRADTNSGDEARAETMKRTAADSALQENAAEPLGVEEARQLRGTGWDGDLDEVRCGRPMRS